MTAPFQKVNTIEVRNLREAPTQNIHPNFTDNLRIR